MKRHLIMLFYDNILSYNTEQKVLTSINIHWQGDVLSDRFLNNETWVIQITSLSILALKCNQGTQKSTLFQTVVQHSERDIWGWPPVGRDLFPGVTRSAERAETKLLLLLQHMSICAHEKHSKPWWLLSLVPQRRKGFVCTNTTVIGKTCFIGYPHYSFEPLKWIVSW